ncbi:MAG: phosphate ABC transporter permease PstA [Gemmatimonadetes bacterium]|nr:phosphate ABC transporter permease PstA [Gemmatimonadota bacterium]
MTAQLPTAGFRDPEFARRLGRRHRAGTWYKWICFAAAAVGVLTLAVLLTDVLIDGARRLSPEFLSSFPSRRPESAGIKAALWGSIWMISLTALMAFPLGVGAAIYLEEYAARNWLNRLIEVNIANLAGVPSIVYGLLGLELFVRALGFGRSLLAGSATMALLILPVIIIASREAIRAVPGSIREASYALGASRWQTTRHHVLPSAFAGILTGTILALSRAIGETAPLIMIGALTFIAFVPEGVLDPFTALPIQIFNWVSRPQPGFHVNAAAGILVLLAVLLLMNSVAIVLRNRFQRKW